MDTLCCSIADPYNFDTDPDPVILGTHQLLHGTYQYPIIYSPVNCWCSWYFFMKKFTFCPQRTFTSAARSPIKQFRSHNFFTQFVLFSLSSLIQYGHWVRTTHMVFKIRLGRKHLFTLATREDLLVCAHVIEQAVLVDIALVTDPTEELPLGNNPAIPPWNTQCVVNVHILTRKNCTCRPIRITMSCLLLSRIYVGRLGL